MALEVGELIARTSIDNSKFESGLDDGESAFKGFGGRIAALSVAAGAAAALAFGTALVGAMDQQDVGAKVVAQLGYAQEDAAHFGHLAGQIYAANFGESVADVGDVLTKVLRANIIPEDAGDEAIQAITEKALVLRDVFEQDLTKGIAAVQNILRNGLAPDAASAMDLLARGIQENVDKADDLMDTFIEYSTQFRDLGLSGHQALGLLSQGLRAGARDADTVADALKEFAIRSKDASKTSKDAFKAIGLNGKTMTDIFAKGGPAAAEGLDQVLDRLRAMPDPVERDAAAVALFGTKAEDLQDSLFALDPSEAVSAIGNVEGAVERAAETMAGTASANIESFKRQLEVAFVDVLGGKVLPVVTEVTGWLSSHFGPALATMGGWIQRNEAWLRPLVTLLGTMGVTIGIVVTAMKIWAAVTGALTAAQVALNIAMDANPVGLVIIAIAALIGVLIWAYNEVDWFREAVQYAWKGIQWSVGKVVDWIVAYVWPVLQAVWEGIAAGAIWLWQNVLVPAGVGIAAVFGWIVDAALWLWHNVLEPFGVGVGVIFASVANFVKSVAALWLWLNQQVFGPVVAAILFGIDLLGDGWSWLWEHAIGPAIRAIGAAASWLWNTMLKPAFDLIMKGVRWLGDGWNIVFGAISQVASSAFAGAIAIAKGGINMLIDLVNRATGFINDNLIATLNKVPGVSFGNIPRIPRLANAGTVQPTAGGRPVIMGDGGEVEYGIPHSAMERIIARAVGAGGGGNSTITLIIADPVGVVRETVRIQGGETNTVLVGS